MAFLAIPFIFGGAIMGVERIADSIGIHTLAFQMGLHVDHVFVDEGAYDMQRAAQVATVSAERMLEEFKVQASHEFYGAIRKGATFGYMILFFMIILIFGLQRAHNMTTLTRIILYIIIFLANTLISHLLEYAPIIIFGPSVIVLLFAWTWRNAEPPTPSQMGQA
jgi:hypothetical protein